MRNSLTKETFSFSSVFDCMRQTGKTEGYILTRLKKQNKNYDDGISFKDNDGKDWMPLDTRVTKSLVTKAAAIKNIFTNEIFVFDNFFQAAKYLKTNITTISNHCNSERKITYKGFVIRFMQENISWPVFTYSELCKIRSRLK
jgi:hypothetical protein